MKGLYCKFSVLDLESDHSVVNAVIIFSLIGNFQIRELESDLNKAKMSSLDLETQLRAKVTSLESQLTELETARKIEQEESQHRIVSLQCKLITVLMLLRVNMQENLLQK